VPEFIPGLKLAEALYFEAAKPILERYFPHLPLSAALLGWGSEVLGYDDLLSTDHNWGRDVSYFFRNEITLRIPTL
jgi:hypothetical protein